MGVRLRCDVCVIVPIYSSERRKEGQIVPLSLVYKCFFTTQQSIDIDDGGSGIVGRN